MHDKCKLNLTIQKYLVNFILDLCKEMVLFFGIPRIYILEYLHFKDDYIFCSQTFFLHFWIGSRVGWLMAANNTDTVPPDYSTTFQWGCHFASTGESSSHCDGSVCVLWGDMWIFCHQIYGELSSDKVSFETVLRLRTFARWWILAWQVWILHMIKFFFCYSV